MTGVRQDATSGGGWPPPDAATAQGPTDSDADRQNGGPGGRRNAGPAAAPRWLLACYPRSWRQRYGTEFAELLRAEHAELGRSWCREANVAAAGLRARLASAGLAGHPLEPGAAARAGLATIAVSLSAAGIAGVALWARLAIGLQWSLPPAPGLTKSMDLMSGALVLIGAAGVLACAPVARAGVLAIARRQARALRLPAALVAAGAAVLVVGGRHFQNGWPGTGGHLLAHQGLVPGGLAAFGWAATMWVTSYWAHPAALSAFPAAQVAWMAASPAAVGCLAAGAVMLVRRLPISPRTLRYQAVVAAAGGAGVVLLGAGALSWLVATASDPVPLFRVGAIGRACLAVLALAAIAGACAARQSWAAGRAFGGPSAR